MALMFGKLRVANVQESDRLGLKSMRICRAGLASEDFLNGLTEAQRKRSVRLASSLSFPLIRRPKPLLAEHMSISFDETYATNAFAFQTGQDRRPHYSP
jgi:hypothetical protein